MRFQSCHSSPKVTHKYSLNQIFWFLINVIFLKWNLHGDLYLLKTKFHDQNKRVYKNVKDYSCICFTVGSVCSRCIFLYLWVARIYERKKEINYVTLSSKLTFFTKYFYGVYLWENEVGKPYITYEKYKRIKNCNRKIWSSNTVCKS
jgi:hypothetical protein